MRRIDVLVIGMLMCPGSVWSQECPGTKEEAEIAIMEGKSLAKCRMVGLDLSDIYLGDSDLRGADFSDSDLSLSILITANLSGANLSGADCKSATFYQANLRGVDFGGANLTNTALSRADLRDVDFSDANLTDAFLDDADLSTAKNLTQAQINLTCGNRSTKIPVGLTRPVQWDRDIECDTDTAEQ